MSSRALNANAQETPHFHLTHVASIDYKLPKNNDPLIPAYSMDYKLLDKQGGGGTQWRTTSSQQARLDGLCYDGLCGSARAAGSLKQPFFFIQGGSSAVLVRLVVSVFSLATRHSSLATAPKC